MDDKPIDMNEIENYQFTESELSRNLENDEKGKNSGKKKESLVKKIGKIIARTIGVLVIVFLVLGEIGSHFLKSNSNNGYEQTYRESNAYQSPTNTSSSVSSAEDQKVKAIAAIRFMAETFEPMTIGYTSVTGLDVLSDEKYMRYNCELTNIGKNRLREVEKFIEENEKSFKEEKLYRFLLLPDSTKNTLLNVLGKAGYALSYRMNFSSGRSVEAVLTPKEIRQAEMTLSRVTLYKKLAAIECMFGNINVPYYVDEETGEEIHIEESQLNKLSRKHEVILGCFIEGSDFVMKFSEPESDGVYVESMGEYMTEEMKKEMMSSFCDPASGTNLLAKEIAISKYDLVLRYIGARSGTVCDVRFPNSMVLCEVILKDTMKN